MTTVGELRARLANDLADPGHVTWPWDVLAGYLREGFEIIARVRPDAFAAGRVLRLEGGREWHDVCDCARLSRDAVVGQCDSAGVVFNRLAPVVEAGFWPGRDLPPKGGRKPLKLREFSVEDDGLKLRVYPRIPPGTVVHVLVRCPVAPDFHDPEAEIDGGYDVLLCQWVLYRALMVDGERGAAATSVAQSHLILFNSLLGGGAPTDQAPNRRRRSDA